MSFHSLISWTLCLSVVPWTRQDSKTLVDCIKVRQCKDSLGSSNKPETFINSYLGDRVVMVTHYVHVCVFCMCVYIMYTCEIRKVLRTLNLQPGYATEEDSSIRKGFFETSTWQGQTAVLASAEPSVTCCSDWSTCVGSNWGFLAR